MSLLRTKVWIGLNSGLMGLLSSACALAADPTLLIAPTGSQTGTYGLYYGLTLSGTGDVNGDGFGDFGVGVGRGAWIYFGGVSPDSHPDHSLGNFPDGSANVMHGVGDMNGDGFGDFVVGAGTTWHGFYFGGPSSPSSQPQIETWSYPVSPNYAGSSNVFPPNSAAAGDMNGDGYDDVVIVDKESNSRAGRGYVLLGGANPDAVADKSLPAPPGAYLFGRSVAGAGDLNGDGYDDVIVGGNFHAYIFFGGTVLDSIPNLTLTEPSPSSVFGSAVAGGIDVNGDGYDDVVVADPFFNGGYEDGGQIYVYFGGANMNSVVDVVLVGGSTYAEWGTRLAGLGDLDGDGFGDFIAGTATNRVLLYHGGPDATAISRQVIPQQEPGEDFGHIAWAGDLNGDGNAEFLVGAPLNDAAGPDFGRAYVFTGYVSPVAIADDPVPPGLILVARNPQTSGYLDLSVTAPRGGATRLDLFDVAGRRLTRLDLGNMNAGERHEIRWPLQTLVSGTYFVLLQLDHTVIATSRVVFVR